MKVIYFAWLRQRLGKREEDISPPDEIDTPRKLINWLSEQDTVYAGVFNDLSTIKVAIDQEYGSLDSDLSSASEIAFFPPVTGG